MLKNSVTDDVVFENSFAVIIGKPAVIRALDGFAVLKPMSLSHAENVVTIQVSQKEQISCAAYSRVPHRKARTMAQ